MYNVNVRNIHTPNVVVGMLLAFGGLAQFTAGMWEFPKGNTFGATCGYIYFSRTVVPTLHFPPIFGAEMAGMGVRYFSPLLSFQRKKTLSQLIGEDKHPSASFSDMYFRLSFY
jgi:hypothetical protein